MHMKHKNQTQKKLPLAKTNINYKTLV